MNYYEIVQSLEESFRRRFTVAKHLDHPFMFGGPDLLAGAKGVAYAIFIPKVSEIGRPSRLLVRLTKARLALPSRTVCVLVTTADRQAIISEAMHLNFDQIIELERIAEVVNAATGTVVHNIVDLAKIRRNALRRTAILLDMGLRIDDKSPTPVSSEQILQMFRDQFDAQPTTLPPWGQQGENRRVNKFLTGNKIIATAVNFSNRNSIQPVLQPVVDFGFRSGFSLDKGVPYPVAPSINMLLVDKVPHIAHDPQKPLRCAALAGWLMITPRPFDEYQQVVADANEKLRAAVVED